MTNVLRPLTPVLASVFALHGCGAAPTAAPWLSVASVAASVESPAAELPRGPPVLVPQLEGRVFASAASPDGRLLVATTWRGVHLVELADGRTRGFLPLLTTGDVAFSSDGATVFIGDTTSSLLHAWSLDDDTVRDVPLPAPSPRLAPGTSATQVLAYRSAHPSAVQMVDVARGEARTIDVGEGNAPLDLRMTPDGVAVYVGTKSIVVARPGAAPGRLDLRFVPASAAIERSGRYAVVMNGEASDGAVDVVVDLVSMRVRARQGACGARSAAAITPDGAHIVAVCPASKQLVVLNPDLEVERAGRFQDMPTFVRVVRDWVFVGDQATRTVLRFDLRAVDPRLAPERFLDGSAPFTESGERTLIRAEYDRIIVYDPESGEALLGFGRYRDDTGFAEGKNGVLRSDWADVGFDVERRALATARLTEDGLASYGVRVDPARRSDAYVFTRLDGSSETWALPLVGSPTWVSRKGSFVFGEASDGNAYCGVIEFVGRRGEHGRTPCAASFRSAMSPREDVIASLGSCGGSVTGRCSTIDLTPLSGGDVTHIPIPGVWVERLSFSADGAVLVAGDAVYDVETRSVRWRLAANEGHAWAPPNWNVVVVAMDADSDRTSLRFADPRTGETVATAPYEEVLATSPRGAFAVLRAGEQLALLDTRSRSVTTLALRGSDSIQAYVGDEGRFVWLSIDGTRRVYRVSDGRVLSYVACHGCADRDVAGLVTDEGAVDRPRAASAFAVRTVALLGPRSGDGLEALDAFPAGFVRPNLEEDFFAERDVSPRP